MSPWLEPLNLWARVRALLAGSPGRACAQLVGLAALGAAGVASAMYLGTTYLSTDWNADLGFRPVGMMTFDPFRTTLIGFVLAPVSLAVMYLLLLPLYRRPRQPLAAFAVAVVGALPVYAAGLLLFALPAVVLLFAAFVLSCFWWSAGVREVLGISGGEATEFSVIALLGSGVLLQFGGALVSGLL